MGLHRVLSELEWRDGLGLEFLQFVVVDRGVPEGQRTIGAPEVAGRDRSYLHLVGGGSIPYHRVLEVRAAGRVLWRKGGMAEEGGRQ